MSASDLRAAFEAAVSGIQLAEHLDPLIARVQEEDRHLLDLAAAFEAACDPIGEGQLWNGKQFDVVSHLRIVGERLTRFCTEFSRLGRMFKFDELNSTSVRQEFLRNMWLDDPPAARIADLGDALITAALQPGTDVGDELARVCQAAEGIGRDMIVWALQYVSLVLYRLVMTGCFSCRTRNQSQILALAREVEGDYRRQSEWTGPDLARIRLRLEALEQWVGSTHTAQRPPLIELGRSDVPSTAIEKLNRIRKALSSRRADKSARNTDAKASNIPTSEPVDPVALGLAIIAKAKAQEEKLNQTKLARRMGVSRTALRDAQRYSLVRDRAKTELGIVWGTRIEAKPVWQGPRGEKNLGVLEALDHRNAAEEDPEL